MPKTPQQLMLPAFPRDWGHPSEVERWGISIQAALQRLHLTVTYLLNATVKNSTAADRTATPDVDECFAYETDTDALYIGADGVWEQVSPIRGRMTVDVGATQVIVPLSPEVAGAYSVVATPGWLTTYRVTDRTSSSFTVDFGTAAPGDASRRVFWFLMEDAA